MSGRRIAAALSVVLLTGCINIGPSVNSTLGGLPPARDVKVLYPAWHRALVLGGDRTYTPFEGSAPVAIPSAGRILVGTSTGSFYALRSQDGQMLWSYDTGESIHSIPALGEDDETVYFGNEAGGLFALDTKTGQEQWMYSATAEIRCKPLVHQQIVVVKDVRGKVHAVDGRDGNGLWLYRSDAPEGYTIAASVGVALAKGRVITGFTDGTAVGLKLLDGTEAWKTDLSEFMPGDPVMGAEKYDVNTTPVLIDKDNVLFSSYKGGLFVLDPRTGEIRWRRSDLDRISGLAVAGGRVYAARASDGVIALDEKGDTIWRSKFSSGTLNRPVYYQGRLFLTDSKYGLIVLDGATGRVLDRYTPAWGGSSLPLVTADRAFLFTNGGHLFSFFLDKPGF